MKQLLGALAVVAATSALRAQGLEVDAVSIQEIQPDAPISLHAITLTAPVICRYSYVYPQPEGPPFYESGFWGEEGVSLIRPYAFVYLLSPRTLPCEPGGTYIATITAEEPHVPNMAIYRMRCGEVIRQWHGGHPYVESVLHVNEELEDYGFSGFLGELVSGCDRLRDYWLVLEQPHPIISPPRPSPSRHRPIVPPLLVGS